MGFLASVIIGTANMRLATKPQATAIEVKPATGAPVLDRLPPPEGRHRTWPVCAAIAVAIALRLAQYLSNRSVWLDEANLALNIIHRSFSGLLQPLDYHQGAPVGFLLAEKLLTRIFGVGEYGLRLLPLLAGFASVFLFYAVARRILRPGAMAIATTLFAVSAPLIYYSSEIKQYSSDVAFALLIYALILGDAMENWSAGRLIVLSLAGAAVIWFSHASVFVLAGIGGSALLLLAFRKQWRPLLRLSLPCLVWAVSLTVFYFVSLRHLTHDSALLDYWQGNFMPLPPRSISDLKWFVDSFFNLFSQAAGFELAGVAALAFLVGTVHMYARDREKVLFLLSPLLLTLIVSGLGKYPFGGRLALFLVPGLLILIAEGAEQIRTLPSRYAAGAGYILLFLLFLYPMANAAHHLLKPHSPVATPGTPSPEEIKPVMRYVWVHELAGDAIYVVTGAQPAYRYYDEIYGRREANLVPGIAMDDNSLDYVKDLDRLRGRRAWIVLSHINGSGAAQAKHILFYMDLTATRLDHFAAPGAEVYLYDLRKDTPTGVSNQAKGASARSN